MMMMMMISIGSVRSGCSRNTVRTNSRPTSRMMCYSHRPVVWRRQKFQNTATPPPTQLSSTHCAQVSNSPVFLLLFGGNLLATSRRNVNLGNRSHVLGFLTAQKMCQLSYLVHWRRNLTRCQKPCRIIRARRCLLSFDDSERLDGKK